MDPAAFLSALLAIVVIDLVLAGDNAIVIALAARSLPVALQKRAIVWGAVGAIGVRSLMTVIVVWLLHIPGLLLAGGLLLLWIAYRLLLPDADAGDAHGPAPATFWGAMRTIVIADAVMGLDNVLAVAGAAHGSYLLVVTGLVISVPIVVWGSTMVLKVVDRYPGRRLLRRRRPRLDRGEDDQRRAAAQAVARGDADARAARAIWRFRSSSAPASSGTIAISSRGSMPGWRRRATRCRPAPARRRRRRRRPPRAAAAAARINRRRAARAERPRPRRRVAERASRRPPRDRRIPAPSRAALHLLNVQPRLSRHAARFVSRADRDGWLHDRADVAMSAAVALLTDAGVPHEKHWAIGERAEQICRAARRLDIHHIVMGTARKNSITRMLEDSVTHRVLETTPVPVEVVAGDAVSRWERWGLPAGVARPRRPARSRGRLSGRGAAARLSSSGTRA